MKRGLLGVIGVTLLALAAVAGPRGIVIPDPGDVPVLRVDAGIFVGITGDLEHRPFLSVGFGTLREADGHSVLEVKWIAEEAIATRPATLIEGDYRDAYMAFVDLALLSSSRYDVVDVFYLGTAAGMLLPGPPVWGVMKAYRKDGVWYTYAYKITDAVPLVTGMTTVIGVRLEDRYFPIVYLVHPDDAELYEGLVALFAARKGR